MLILKGMRLRLFLTAMTTLSIGFACCRNPSSSHRIEKVVVSTRGAKICQLVGDFDREKKEFTLNLTGVRAHLLGTDLGVSFVHKDRLMVYFGDSFGGRDPNDDAMAYTTDTNPEDGLSLEIIQELGIYRSVQIPGINRGAYEVPVEGVSIQNTLYLYFATDWNDFSQVMGRTVLARSTDDGWSYTYMHDISETRFINVSVEKVDGSLWPSLNSVGDALVIFGSGPYRKSPVYLAVQPALSIENKATLRYFAGLSSGEPLWSVNETDAVPLFSGSGVGELSVMYYPVFEKWVMLYNHLNPRGIQMRSADDPWGPWSDAQVLFDPAADGGYCHFMHTNWQTAVCDSVHDPGRENEWGGEYGPYQLGPLAKDESGSLTLYFTMSTWNPYTVVLMKAVIGKE